MNSYAALAVIAAASTITIAIAGENQLRRPFLSGTFTDKMWLDDMLKGV